MIKRLIKSVLAGSAATAHRPSKPIPRTPPDWVLMDIEMKEVDGIAATR